MGSRKGFGSVRVRARVGRSEWQTSVFPDSRSQSYLLPVKASVRRTEKVSDGDPVSVGLSLLAA